MKKWTALLLASAIALSLTACGSGESTESPGSASTGTEDIGTAVESKGLFVLDRSSGIDLSQEENLSERETYLIHVYDIIPDDAKNVDMSQFNSDYTVLLNGVNTYESSTTYGGTALNSFLLGSGYQLDREIGTVFAGDDAQLPGGFLQLFPAFGAGGNLRPLQDAGLQKSLCHGLGHVPKADKSYSVLCHCGSSPFAAQGGPVSFKESIAHIGPNKKETFLSKNTQPSLRI